MERPKTVEDDLIRLKRLFWKMEDIIEESRSIEISGNATRFPEVKMAYIPERELDAYKRIEKLIRKENQ